MRTLLPHQVSALPPSHVYSLSACRLPSPLLLSRTSCCDDDLLAPTNSPLFSSLSSPLSSSLARSLHPPHLIAGASTAGCSKARPTSAGAALSATPTQSRLSPSHAHRECSRAIRSVCITTRTMTSLSHTAWRPAKSSTPICPRAARSGPPSPLPSPPPPLLARSLRRLPTSYLPRCPPLHRQATRSHAHRAQPPAHWCCFRLSRRPTLAAPLAPRPLARLPPRLAWTPDRVAAYARGGTSRARLAPPCGFPMSP